MTRVAAFALALALFSQLEGVLSDTRQQNKTHEFGPRACGPADPSYIRVANETGGQPFFLSPSELAGSGHIMRERALTDRELVLWAHGLSENAPREYDVPVDASVERLTIAASFDRQGGTMNVISADFTVNAKPPGAEESIFNCAHVLTVDRPATGNWQARLVATGRFWIVAHAQTDLSLVTAHFVRPGGGPGHEGLFPIGGQPLAGTPATLRTRTSGIPGTPRFMLVSIDGTVILELDLKKSDDEEFIGSIPLPTQPFRVVATGIDAAGHRYQRVHAPLFRAASVELTITPIESLRAGSTTPIPIVVRNHGAAGRFRIVAVYGQGVVGDVQPALVDVAQGAEVTVTASVKVPDNARPASTFRLTVTAESQDTALITNSAFHEFTIVSPQL
jgi:hypothetical protein